MKERFLSQNKVQQMIHARFRLRNYKTPLWCVEKRLHHADDEKRDELLAMKNMLVDKGGRSLTIYPREIFPGHL